MKFKRIFLMILDSLGVGEADDASKYNSKGANTLGHILEQTDLFIPNLKKIGLLNTINMDENENVDAYYTIAKPNNIGKDSLNGHYEMMGILSDTVFKTFNEGFPNEILDSIENITGRRVIGNKPCGNSIDIINELGELELNYGSLIVYTSADSVLQICGNEKTFDLANLYRCCEIARKLTLKEEWRVGRVIARPYVGDSPENFKRTSNRHDYALKPTNKTAMDALKENGYDVLAVGKIHDIFDGEGITDSVHSVSSVNGMDQTIDYAKTDFTGLCFTNLVDFDALWGHRRNPEGYAAELERFDVKLGEFLKVLRDDDLLMITADHGNDPTYTGTDHTREYVPLLLYSPKLKISGNLPESDSFADIGATIASNFGVAMPEGTIGTPMKEILD